MYFNWSKNVLLSNNQRFANSKILQFFPAQRNIQRFAKTKPSRSDSVLFFFSLTLLNNKRRSESMLSNSVDWQSNIESTIRNESRMHHYVQLTMPRSLQRVNWFHYVEFKNVNIRFRLRSLTKMWHFFF